MQAVVAERAEAGRRLASVRNRLGMSQMQFGEMLGVSHRTIQGYEGGKNEISSEVLRALHAKHGINSDWLLFGPTVAPEVGGRAAHAAEMAQQVYEAWETFLSDAAIRIPVEAKALLFNVFVEMAILSSEVPLAQMEQSAEKLKKRVEPKG